MTKEENLSITVLQGIADQLHVSLSRVSMTDGKNIIQGKYGHVDSNWNVFLEVRSKRHMSGLKRRLDFMRLLNADDNMIEFTVNHPPSADEAKMLRDALGIRKRPTSTVEIVQIAA